MIMNTTKPASQEITSYQTDDDAVKVDVQMDAKTV
jgi:hypothetical protein